jgi:hypothetical protein
MYLGFQILKGIDADFFLIIKGGHLIYLMIVGPGLTKGFHMDIDASGVTIDSVVLPLGTGGTPQPNIWV